MLVVALMAAEASASSIVINEVYRDTGFSSTGTEWMEVVLLVDHTAAQLDGYYLGDSTSSTAAKFAGYRLNNMGFFASTFPAGTILVLAGGAGPAEDTSYDPANGDWNIVLRTSNPTHVVSNGSVGDFAGTDVAYVDTNGTNGNTALDPVGFAVNWDSTPGTFGAVASVTTAVPPSIGALANGADLAGATVAGNWVAIAATPGAGNNATNTAAIEALRPIVCGDGDDDGDGVCNDVDVCPGDDALDADLDTVPDACDVCPGGHDYDDQDGDGVPGFCDVCTGADDNQDADSDGVPDACDLCEGSDDGTDADLDGTPDGCDVCAGSDDDADADNDGVPDGCDICGNGPDWLDGDFDGVPDHCDQCAGEDGTADSDLDGVPDNCDACPGEDDTLDTDNDTVADGCDVCEGGYDPADADSDGVPDACDSCSVPPVTDGDGDGVPDGCDICFGHDDVFDADLDGVPDGCDECAGFDDAPDGDFDGVADGCDICLAGDDASDADADSVPDACDACPGSDDALDADGDAVPDGCDACAGSDDALDADFDGVADGCDVCPAGDDAADDDGDLVADACDACPGEDDALDADGDGVPDACDLRLRLTGTVAPNQVIQFRAQGAVPGEVVQFRWSPGGIGVGPCLASLGGHCMSLGAPVDVIGAAVANASGTAIRNYTVPSTATPGQVVSFQAYVVRGAGGVDSDLTFPPISRVTQP